MDLQNEKCVMVIDENLPSGIIANTAAIMGITHMWSVVWDYWKALRILKTY